MTLQYPKTYGNRIYIILDETKYRRYWWGRRPSSRRIFEEWLNDPDTTMHETSKAHGKYSHTIQSHTTNLVKLGIMVRRNGE